VKCFLPLVVSGFSRNDFNSTSCLISFIGFVYFLFDVKIEGD
jgi:hypothetical protein